MSRIHSICRLTRRVAVSIAVLLLAISPLAADVAENLGAALAKGTPNLSLRYRFETVDQDDFDKDANASTLRTLLGYSTMSYKGWSFHLQAEDVSYIGHDAFNSTSNGTTDRPVVADPAGTEMTQVLLKYHLEKNEFRLGRQEVNIGDQRFVGAVGWRQHHQTFDAFRFENTALDKWTFNYSYLDKVRRITRDTREMNSHLLDVGVDLGIGTLSGYGYLLDYTEAGFFGLSTNTYGLEFKGAHPLESGTKLLYELEYAGQSDGYDNPNSVSADYLFAMFGAAFKPITIQLGYEVLEGSAEQGQFTTSLATAHKFNGWADKFLKTPVDGLEDFYLALSGKVSAIAWKAIYHDFSANTGGMSYGDEIDFLLSYKAPWKQTFALKGALYSADEFSVDTSKIWLYTAWHI